MQANRIGPGYTHLELAHPHVDLLAEPEEDEVRHFTTADGQRWSALDTHLKRSENGNHDEPEGRQAQAGRGKPRHDAPGGRQDDAGSAQVQQQELDQGPGRNEPEGTPTSRELRLHPSFEKDLRKIGQGGDKIASRIEDKIESLRAGEADPSTHPVPHDIGPGWLSTRVGQRHRIIHRNHPEDNALEIGGVVRAHDYREMGRRLATTEPRPIDHELDEHLEQAFHPQQMEAEKARHPRSGFMVDVGHDRVIEHSRLNGQSSPGHPFGEEGPAEFTVRDHGPSAGERHNMGMRPNIIGTEPIQHVYRGMGIHEYNEAQERGYISSDRRGTIHESEGTNAAADPRSAASYLPRGQHGMIVKIKTHPEHNWFTIRADGYLRSREKIPFEHVEHAEPYSKTISGRFYAGHPDPNLLEDDPKGRYARPPQFQPRAARKFCPCGTPVEFDPIDGWQHADGSIGHGHDDEFYDKSVSDLVGTTPPKTAAEQHWDRSRVFWHGSPSGDLRGGPSGLHVGTQEAARQALHARIGFRADGKDWDGTQEYGKTQLAGKQNLLAREGGHYLLTGHNMRAPEHDYYPHERPDMPKFGNNESSVQSHHKPDLFPVRITGEMTNAPHSPHPDFKANGYMKAQISRGNARRGYFYTNIGEDSGSISAVVPGPGHIQRLDQRTATAKSDLLHRGVMVETDPHELIEAHDNGGMAAVHQHLIDQVTKPQPSWNNPHPESTGLGTHWTSRPEVAQQFAHGHYHHEPDSQPRIRVDGHGTEMHIPVVLHGHVDPEHHVTDPAELRNAMVEGHGWTGLTHRDERETLVRRDAPVHVTGIEASLPSHPGWIHDLIRHVEEGGQNPEDHPHHWQSIGGAGQHTAMADTMPLDELRSIPTEDYGVTIDKVRPAMRREWKGPDSPRGSWRDHDGPDGYIEHLTRQIAQHGISEPIEIGHRPDGTRTIYDGTHRALIAHEQGIDPVRVKNFRMVKGQHYGARFTPEKRVFTHTDGLDHRLFDEHEHLRPEVRAYVLQSITVWWMFHYRDWAKWARIYFAGSEASEWTSSTLEGNNDFDVLIGVDYDGFRKANPMFAELTNQQITDRMNDQFRQHFNGPVWIPIRLGSDSVGLDAWPHHGNSNPDRLHNSSSNTGRALQPPSSRENSGSISPRSAGTSNLPESSEINPVEKGSTTARRFPNVSTVNVSYLIADGSGAGSAKFGTTGPTTSDMSSRSASRSMPGSSMNSDLVAGSVGGPKQNPSSSSSIMSMPAVPEGRAAGSAFEGFSVSAVIDSSDGWGKRISSPQPTMSNDGPPPEPLPEGYIWTGPWDRTTFCNPDSYDIRRIKPYAAYDVGKDAWVVKPPHLPHWSFSDLSKPDQRTLRAADAYARSVLKLPEPERTQQGAALFEAWHSDRSRAFSDRGEGWYDIANLREKWLDQAGLWAELVACAHRAKEGLDAAPADWSNTPPGYTAKTAAVEDHLPPGYDMRVQEVEKTERWGLPQTHIKIHHEGKPQPVASLSVHQRTDPDTGSLVGHPNIHVDLAHRRKGLATAMYAEMHRRWPGLPIKHSEHRSDDARALDPVLKERFGPDLHYGYLGQLDAREAMAWHPDNHLDNETAQPRPVREAGFRGYVGSDHEHYAPAHDPHDEFDEDLWDEHRPEPTHEEQAHYEEHGDYPDSHHERHDEAYGKAIQERRDKAAMDDLPTHVDNHLHHFIDEHGADTSHWHEKNGPQPQDVDISKGVYATQSHVAQYHIDRYKKHRDEPVWHIQNGGYSGGYLADEHPLFVKHDNRLHVIDGHHRVAADIQMGKKTSHGYFYDLDKHPTASDHEGGTCEECKDEARDCGLHTPHQQRAAAGGRPSNWNINPKTRDAQSEIEFARKHRNTADRGEADPEYEDALQASREDAHREHDQAQLAMWLAQRPNPPREAKVAAVDHMPLEQFRQLNSTDHGVPVAHLRDALRHEHENHRHDAKWGGEDPDDPDTLINWGAHDNDAKHGGPDNYIDQLKRDIAEHGLREPVKVGPSRVDGPGIHLFDGNHRAVAIHELGIDPVPVHWVGKQAKGLPKTQKCEYCSEQATKRLLWAEGMGYIPVCDSHEDKGRHQIEVTNKDEVVSVQKVGSTQTDTLDQIGRQEHPNVDHYRSGGVGHLEDDESRSVVGFMPVHVMKRYREHAGDWNGAHSQEVVDSIRKDIREGKGIHTPLMVEYSDQDKWGYLGEGNHRLRAAEEEGLRTVPVRVVRGAARAGSAKKRRVGAPMDLQERFNPRDPDYVPSDIHPYHFLREAQLSTTAAKAHDIYGKGELHHLFPTDEDGPAPTTSAPWPIASRRRDVRDYDPKIVQHALEHPHQYPSEEIDPRDLHATQPSIVRAGVQHYLGDEYRLRGRTFADQHNPGNARPVVYRREDGQNLILSGHHRGVAALLKGEPLEAVVLRGPWGPPRGGAR